MSKIDILADTVREDYKSRAKAAERLVVRLQVDVETFKQVAHFHAASKVLAHQQLDLTEARVAELEGALAEGIEAFRLTREYVGESLLPRIEGWSWFDWCEKAAALIEGSP